MKKISDKVLVAILLTLIAVVFFRNYFFKNLIPFPSNLLVTFYEPFISYSKEYGGIANKPLGFDNLRIFYPLRKLTIDEVKNFQWPLWNPYSFSGNTQLATYQSAVFHPLSFLFFMMPQIDAWSAITALQPILSGFFMYLFLRQLKLGKKSSFFGSIVFAFSGWMIVFWEESFMAVYSALFLPLALYAIERLIKKISPFDYILLTLALSFSILSGWFQTTFYLFIFAASWVIYRIFTLKLSRPKILLIFSSFVLSFVIPAIHLLPSLEAYLYSARGNTDAHFLFDIYLLPLKNLITFFAPDFFGNPGTYNYFGGGFFYERVIFVGIAPLLLGVYEFFYQNKKKTVENFFKISWIVTLSLGFALPTSWFILYDLNLPFLSTSIPTRIFFLATFSLATLAAFGLEHFSSQKVKIKNTILIIASLAWIFAEASRNFIEEHNILYPTLGYAKVSLRNIILPSFMLASTSILLTSGIFLSKKLKEGIAILFIILSLSSSFYFANKYLSFSERKYLYPDIPVIKELKKLGGYSRFWSINKGYIDRNFSAYYGLYSPEGYDSFYIKRYGELLFSAQNKGKYSAQIPRTDATLSYTDYLDQLLLSPYRRKLMSLLSVKHIAVRNDLDRSDSVETAEFKRVWKDDKYSIYEYRDSLPRVMLLTNFKIAKTQQEILDVMFSSDTDLSKTAILEENPPNFKPGSLRGSARIISYSPNEVKIETQSDKDAILFISDNYYPGWNAYIEGVSSKVYRTDYAFRSVVVPKGKHAVVFKYEPKVFYQGLYLTIVGILILTLISFKIKSKSKK